MFGWYPELNVITHGQGRWLQGLAQDVAFAQAQGCLQVPDINCDIPPNCRSTLFRRKQWRGWTYGARPIGLL